MGGLKLWNIYAEDHSQVRSATPSPFPRPWSVAEWAGKRRNRAMTGQEVASNTKKMKEETAVSPRLIKFVLLCTNI